MSCNTRLDIRGKCFTVKDQGGCLLIRRGPAEMGHEHILCVQGDERILIDAFDEYMATDVFEHYVRCRDINYLRDTSHSFDTKDVIGLEFNFIHTDPGESSDLTFTSGDKTATVTTSVQGTTTEPIFTFGDDLNSIQFTEPETKKVKVGDLWYIVTFVSFTTAVFTIDRIAKILFPEGTIAAVDDIIGEVVVIDDTVKPLPSLITKIDELLGEIVFTDTEPEFVYKSMLDELVGELVFTDISLDFLPPTDIFCCDIPDLPPPSPTAVSHFVGRKEGSLERERR